MDVRHTVWFSAGAASAAVAYLTPHADLVYCETGSEHADNVRFIADCESWLGRRVVRLKSNEYADIWDVFARTRYINGPRGARCTVELKKRPRFAYQKAGDVHYFGYTDEERDRAKRFIDNNPDIDARFPLIERSLSKQDCLAMVARAGIEIPAMYRLGYKNNNCIGCPKGGAGYWSKIKSDFPDVFTKMSIIERDVGATCIKGMYLDELVPDASGYGSEPDMSCGLLCEAAIAEASL